MAAVVVASDGVPMVMTVVVVDVRDLGFVVVLVVAVGLDDVVLVK